MANNTVIDTRIISFKILYAILHKGNPAHEVFNTQGSWNKLSSRDRAFVKLLVMSCVRKYGQLNICINTFIKRPPKPKIRIVIMLGAAQLLILKTEPYAAIHTSVLLARHLTGNNYTGLTNGILRTISRSGKKVFEATSPLDNLPDFFKRDWLENWGENTVQQIMKLAQNQPPLDITLKKESKDSKIEWSKKLSAKLISPSSIRLSPVADVPSLAGYNEGEWWVQDCAAALPARLMGDIRGKQVIDLCAAPGGKTAQLAAAGAIVLAIDNNAKRIKRLSDNLSRLGLNAEIICSDGRNYVPDMLVDGVLLDAPCSATGTIRRRPDVLIGKTAKQILELQALQIELCLAASKWIKKGGTLVYATCSLQKQEGEEVIEELISRCNTNLILDPISLSEADLFFPLNCDQKRVDYLRILPDQLLKNKSDLHGNDGFFIARFKIQ